MEHKNIDEIEIIKNYVIFTMYVEGSHLNVSEGSHL